MPIEAAGLGELPVQLWRDLVSAQGRPLHNHQISELNNIRHLTAQ